MKNHLIKLFGLLAFGLAHVAHADPLLVSVTIGSQAPASINPGSNATYTVTVNRTNSGAMVINLSCLGLPAGASASFSPNPVVFGSGLPNSKSATLTISTTAAVAQGSYNFTITAQDGGSHNIVTNTATLVVGSDGKNNLTSQNITAIQLLGDGSASISLHAAPSKSYILQATPTISPSAWVNISTNSTDTTGDCILIDSAASTFSSRFYRTTILN